VTVSGSGYPAGETVKIQLNATLLATVTASSGGVFITQVKIPFSAAPGHKTIHATGQSCGCSAQAPFTVIADWLQLQNTSTHVGVQAHESVLSTATVPGLTLEWQIGSGCGGGTESLSVWSAMVYMAGVALNAKTGAVVWENTARSFGNSPAVGDGEVFFGGSSPRQGGSNIWVTAVDAYSGATLWNTKIGTHLLFASPVAANGRVFIGANSFDDHFYALDDATGAVIWSKHVAGGFSATAAVANGVVYAGSNDGRLYAWKAATGGLKWSVLFADAFSGPAVVANGVVYVRQYGMLYALSAATGHTIWSKQVPAAAGNRDTPIVSGGTLYVSAGPALDALNASNGATLWTTPLNSDASYSPALANGVVYVATDGDSDTGASPNLYAVDASNGTILADLPAGGGGSPSIADGYLYETSDCGFEQAFSVP
jgi:outer membrane protein assembly factor BamB